jgi:plastocyanin
MTWLSHICFNAFLVLDIQGAAVSGKVELRDSRDPGVRAKDYSGVVVWLVPSSGAAPEMPARHARMVQKNKTFTPHVLAIPVGSTVDFPNFDPIFHNAFSSYNGQIFDVGLYPPGTSRAVQFSRPGIVRVFCNIHANMSAVIAVLASPWFAVTGRDGEFTLHDVPEGSCTLHVFHERATQPTLDALQQTVTVGSDALRLSPISVSESGYLAIPHKNKYGNDYPPPPDARGAYPAVRK